MIDITIIKLLTLSAVSFTPPSSRTIREVESPATRQAAGRTKACLEMAKVEDRMACILNRKIERSRRCNEVVEYFSTGKRWSEGKLAQSWNGSAELVFSSGLAKPKSAKRHRKSSIFLSPSE